MNHALALALCLAIPAVLPSCGSISKMKETKEIDRPVLSSISPTQVSQGWTGTMKVTGSGFDANSYVYFGHGEKIPTRRVLSSTVIEVAVTPLITGKAQAWSVEVRDSEGNASDELTLRVDRDPSYVPAPVTVNLRKTKDKKSTTGRFQ